MCSEQVCSLLPQLFAQSLWGPLPLQTPESSTHYTYVSSGRNGRYSSHHGTVRSHCTHYTTLHMLLCMSVGIFVGVVVRTCAQEYMHAYTCTRAHVFAHIHVYVCTAAPAAAIYLDSAGSSSLVLVDELGRATSTADGVALSWAVAEYLLALGAHVLLVTHFRHVQTCSNLHTHTHICNSYAVGKSAVCSGLQSQVRTEVTTPVYCGVIQHHHHHSRQLEELAALYPSCRLWRMQVCVRVHGRRYVYASGG
jgi:MutS domain V